MTGSIERLRRATGPWYQDRSVDELDDEFIVTEIEGFRRRAIDTLIAKNPDNWVAMSHSPEGRGDAAVRWIQGSTPSTGRPIACSGTSSSAGP